MAEWRETKLVSNLAEAATRTAACPHHCHSPFASAASSIFFFFSRKVAKSPAYACIIVNIIMHILFFSGFAFPSSSQLVLQLLLVFPFIVLLSVLFPCTFCSAFPRIVIQHQHQLFGLVRLLSIWWQDLLPPPPPPPPPTWPSHSPLPRQAFVHMCL